jgi:hypothetical protein
MTFDLLCLFYIGILGIEPRPTRYKQAALPLSYTPLKF